MFNSKKKTRHPNNHTSKFIFLTFQKNAAVCPSCGYSSCAPGKVCPKCGTRMVAAKGGPGSGYSNHPGRPGKRGGSLPRGTHVGDQGVSGHGVEFTREVNEKMGDEIESFPDEFQEHAEIALSSIQAGEPGFVVYKEGELAGFVSYTISPEQDDVEAYLAIKDPTDSELGEQMLRELCIIAEKTDAQLTIIASYDSQDFFFQYGMFSMDEGVPGEGDLDEEGDPVGAEEFPMYFDSDQVKEFAKTGRIEIKGKSNKVRMRKKSYSKVAKVDEAHKVVYGEVYSPYHIDTDRETMRPEEIRKAAWKFLSTGKVDNIDIQHSLQKSGCQVVESFIAREGDPDFVPGSWVLAVKCPDDVWDKVLKGELNGFSFYGTVEKYPATVLVQVTKQMAGITEKSTHPMVPEHEHTFIVNMDNLGSVVSGRTDSVQGHWHPITKGTATDLSLDHVHRIVLE